MALPEYTDGVLELYRIENDESEDYPEEKLRDPEQGAVRTKFLSIGDKLSARFDNISLLASGKTTIGGASLEVQRDGKGYSGKTGKAVFSDGTYLEYVNGFLVGGNTKEGGF